LGLTRQEGKKRQCSPRNGAGQGGAYKVLCDRGDKNSTSEHIKKTREKEEGYMDLRALDEGSRMERKSSRYSWKRRRRLWERGSGIRETTKRHGLKIGVTAQRREEESEKKQDKT